VIALDLSRLLSRAQSTTPTGIDRVELAYARYLMGSASSFCFAARNAIGGIGLLPVAEASQFIIALAALWRGGAGPAERGRITALARRLNLAALFGERKLHAALRDSDGVPVYLLVSHQNLDRTRAIERLKATTGARFVCLIHDLIPLDFPELTRPGQKRRHQNRIATVVTLADAVIVNSGATHDALWKRLDGKQIPITVAPLGIDLPDAAKRATEHPYFVCIGTIEARKNHRLLIDLWQRLAVELGDRAPCLLLIGRRGFGSESLLGRLGALGDLVIERSDLPDTEMAMLLRDARALLLPSLAEGFGLTVVEALALGVPVLCSDLPALRESGRGVPDYLRPTDIIGWHRAVLDYTADSPRRKAQFSRLAEWQPPSWSAHFAIVERLLADLS
jgi:glycosyltransferase involved in cell wall biosynthesis